MPTIEGNKGDGWIDSHCHLNDLPEPETAWSQAVSGGIDRILIPGTHPEQWPQLRAMRSPQRPVALGTHPWFVQDPEREIEALRSALLNDEVAVIGEIGLDFYRGGKARPTPELQMAVFESQLALAAEYGKPVILHAVKAHQEIIRLLKKYPSVYGVVHAFAGSYPLAQQYLDQGFYLGIGPQLMRSTKLQDTVRSMAGERILLETDAPFMALQKQAVNPLLDLLVVAESVAELRSLSLAELQQQVAANSLQCFGTIWG
ncbi:TatD family hydrolase [Reinekea blandensis]|uniref:Hydrolase, TatD family protein n=1 Tax=Reinekea blandensis MED297 TaxID=314283 RepID=A4BE99_9GAMM|nr:TatD family hydrolase [Reinekea blandensis]EAR09577.1 hydrolase, TatD family protein [Reinekea blandensis MED297]